MKLPSSIGLAVCLLSLTFGCGGGGGGGGGGSTGSSISVSYSPDPLVRTIYQHNPGTTVTLYADVSPVPSGTTYVFLEDPKEVLVHGGVKITDNGGGHYSMDLPINSELPVGQHQGSLTFVLSKDPGATDRYALSDSDVTYEFTVDPLVAASIKVNGLTPGSITPGIDIYGARTYQVSMYSGDEIEITPDKSIESWVEFGPLLAFTRLASTGVVYKAKIDFVPPGTVHYGSIHGQRTINGETVKIELTVFPK